MPDAIVEEALKVLPLGQALGLVLLIVLIGLVWNVKLELERIRIRLDALAQWAEDHDERDDRRFGENREDHRSIWDRINGRIK